ncbi:helix-turn-helix transcriptional regulator [Streptomyces sp. NPDC049577]|uniref:helix-turn-helix domain-containing protein n=1 Tax=Streptomyces sp. NPDC049577 TaxID=3155153 RepID=UPI003437E481
MPRRRRQLTPGRSARHLFGAEMRMQREKAGLSLARLGKIVRYSSSHLARVEVAEVVPPPELPPLLDAAFGTDGIFERIYETARHEPFPDNIQRRLDLENQAEFIKEFAGYFIPGLIQTEGYARELFRGFDHRRTEEKVEELVAERMGRKKLLRSDSPPRIAYVVDEAVLRRPVGTPGVWYEQLATLADLASGSPILVQVLPFAHTEYPALCGQLTLYTLHDNITIAYEEGASRSVSVEDPDLVRRHRDAFAWVSACALSPRDSATFIRMVMKEIPHENNSAALPFGLA